MCPNERKYKDDDEPPPLPRSRTYSCPDLGRLSGACSYARVTPSILCPRLASVVRSFQKPQHGGTRARLPSVSQSSLFTPRKPTRKTKKTNNNVRHNGSLSFLYVLTRLYLCINTHTNVKYLRYRTKYLPPGSPSTVPDGGTTCTITGNKER